MKNHVLDLFRLQNQVALVTGGGRNLGRDMALALAEAGADVAITSRNGEMLERISREIADSTGRTVRGYLLDVTQEADVIEVTGAILKDFGKINILINNAGNMRNSAPLETRSRQDWEYTFAVNSTGTFLCTREVARHMMARRQGVIINIASVAGMIGKDRRPYEGTDMMGITIDYSAAKGAVINMTRDLACYLAPHGIRVNSISMAGFERGQPPKFLQRYKQTIPMGRLGEDGKDIKGAVVYLASEASAFMTGHNLVLDGGCTAW